MGTEDVTVLIALSVGAAGLFMLWSTMMNTGRTARYLKAIDARLEAQAQKEDRAA